DCHDGGKANCVDHFHKHRRQNRPGSTDSCKNWRREAGGMVDRSGGAQVGSRFRTGRRRSDRMPDSSVARLLGDRTCRDQRKNKSKADSAWAPGWEYSSLERFSWAKRVVGLNCYLAITRLAG